MTQRRYNTYWSICAASAMASAWTFDKVHTTMLHILVGGVAIIAGVICVVNHFRMWCQIEKENEQVSREPSPQ